MATKLVAKFLNKTNYVIYESTVYPGTTEEVCIPLLEKHSSLKNFQCKGVNNDIKTKYINQPLTYFLSIKNIAIGKNTRIKCNKFNISAISICDIL